MAMDLEEVEAPSNEADLPNITHSNNHTGTFCTATAEPEKRKALELRQPSVSQQLWLHRYANSPYSLAVLCSSAFN